MRTDPRQVLSDLRALAQEQPGAGDTAHALEATRQALLRRRFHVQRHRRWLRLSVPSGIAACLIAAALVAWFVQTSARASAAVHLQQAVSNAQSYQGWVQLVATPRAAVSVPGRGALVRITCTSNAGEGVYGEIRQFQNDTEINFCSRKENVYETYTGASGEIRRRRLVRDDEDEHPHNVLLPASVGDTLERVKATLGREPAALQHTHDGADVRVDVTLFRSHEEENEFHRRYPQTASPGKFSVWINARHEMTRLECSTPEGTLNSAITYGAAPVESIYDLGVPRTARIVEVRTEGVEGREHDQD